MVYVFMIEQTFSYTNSFNTNVPFLYLQIRSENFFLTRRSHLRCSVKKLFFKISQHSCFPVDFAKLLRTFFFYRITPVAASGICSNVYFSVIHIEPGSKGQKIYDAETWDKFGCMKASLQKWYFTIPFKNIQIDEKA